METTELLERIADRASENGQWDAYNLVHEILCEMDSEVTSDLPSDAFEDWRSEGAMLDVNPDDYEPWEW